MRFGDYFFPLFILSDHHGYQVIYQIIVMCLMNTVMLWTRYWIINQLCSTKLVRTTHTELLNCWLYIRNVKHTYKYLHTIHKKNINYHPHTDKPPPTHKHKYTKTNKRKHIKTHPHTNINTHKVKQTWKYINTHKHPRHNKFPTRPRV